MKLYFKKIMKLYFKLMLEPSCMRCKNQYTYQEFIPFHGKYIKVFKCDLSKSRLNSETPISCNKFSLEYRQL